MSGALGLARVMEEMATVLAQLADLHVTGYPPATISGNAGYISYPRNIAFDQTYGRGQDMYEDVPVVVCVANPTDRRARDRIARWLDSAGPESVKAVFEERSWKSCSDVEITNAEFDVETIAGVDYLTVIFKATVVGPGKGS